MPRIRTIKPEFWGDEKLAPMTPIDRLVFLGLISMADDAGRVLDSIRSIDGFIFPETDDSARESLDRLADLGRVDRGVTASGQRVIQLVNWNHQKIDKPNLSSALPPIVVADESAKVRRRVPPKLRDAIFERDNGVCQTCGVVVRRNKRDRYDSAPDLAEVDHKLALADGGTNDPQNLWLLCLGCNRKKAGEAVRRRNGDESTNDRGNVGDMSTPHINDLRSSTGTDDLRSPTDDRRPKPAAPTSSSMSFREIVETRLESDLDRRALTILLEKVPNAESWCAEMNAALEGMGGHIQVTPMQLGSALREYVANANGDQPKIRHFKGYLSTARAEVHNGATPNQSANLLDRARVLLALAAEYNLLSYYGNAAEYQSLIEAAAADPRAGAGFRDEIAPLKLYDGIGKQETHFAERELVKRMQAAAQAVSA